MFKRRVGQPFPFEVGLSLLTTHDQPFTALYVCPHSMPPCFLLDVRLFICPSTPASAIWSLCVFTNGRWRSCSMTSTADEHNYVSFLLLLGQSQTTGLALNLDLALSVFTVSHTWALWAAAGKCKGAHAFTSPRILIFTKFLRPNTRAVRKRISTILNY